jgi:hypothetical protein
MMDICNNHLFGLIIIIAIAVIGIISVIRDEKDG